MHLKQNKDCLNFGQKRVREKFIEEEYPYSVSHPQDVDVLLATGTVNAVYRQASFFKANDGIFIVQGGVVRWLCDEVEFLDLLGDMTGYIKSNAAYTPSAVILPYRVKSSQPAERKKGQEPKKALIFMLVNADPDGQRFDSSYDPPEYALTRDVDHYELPSVSFECLRCFYGKNTTPADVSARIANGEIEVVDFTPDSHIYPTAKQRKSISVWEKKPAQKRGTYPVPPPGKGYTLIGRDHWHRPATVLLRDKKQGFSMLLGMDENSYFGVELQDSPKTVEAAFQSLMPVCCREISNVERQGEWFAKPVHVENVPPIEECVACFGEDYDLNGVILHRDSPDSARHTLDCTEGRLCKDTIYARNPRLVHERGEHADLNLEGWFSFHRNTAKRSFSVQGVD